MPNSKLPRRISVSDIASSKGRTPIVRLTAYTAQMAKIPGSGTAITRAAKLSLMVGVLYGVKTPAPFLPQKSSKLDPTVGGP